MSDRVRYEQDNIPAPCVGCKKDTRTELVYRGERRPCCGGPRCELWACAGINFALSPKGSWDEID